MLVAQNSLGPVCPVPLTVRGMDLECVVCCELYDTSVHAPMVLPCSGAHEICRTCVAALRKADGAIQCPKCREDATGAVNPNRGLIAALRLSRRS